MILNKEQRMEIFADIQWDLVDSIDWSCLIGFIDEPSKILVFNPFMDITMNNTVNPYEEYGMENMKIFEDGFDKVEALLEKPILETVSSLEIKDVLLSLKKN